MKKRFIVLTITLVVVMSFTLLTGCSNEVAPETATKPVQASTEVSTSKETLASQYISREEVKYAITAIQEDFVLLDLRKAADYEAGHIINAVSADVDSAKSNGDDAPSIENLKSALDKATGKKDGGDRKIVLLCYSGQKYAETATRLLQGMGIDNSRIFTLEGGYKGWTEKDTTGEYQYLLDVVALASETNKPNIFTTSLYQVPRSSDFYFTPEEVKDLIESNEIGNYYVIDTRTQKEYEDGHVVTAYNAPDFVVPNKNEFLPRTDVISNVKAMFEKYPYEEGKKFIVICRGGKGGAQNMDDVLREEFGISNDLIYTMQYGFQAFPESWQKLGKDYEKHIVKGAEPGTVAVQ